MRKEEAIAALRAISAPGDPEAAHIHADEILIQFLRAQGYGEIADAWEAITPKWYA